MVLIDDVCAVKIAVRERPLRVIYGKTVTNSAISYHTVNSNILVVGERSFLFDAVFRPTNTQTEVFLSVVKPLVEKALDGYNCTALAYGQTGTGKSFSMGLNPESFEGDNVGVIPRCLDEIFQAADLENSGKEISASFIEIYNEKVYDLLGNDPNDAVNVKGCKFTGGTKTKISNIQEGYGLLSRGNKNRHVRPTKMNTTSSRSHAIFTIHITRETEGGTSTSSLNLVDLAGSEGVRKTGHQGVALTEGVHINQGLLSIGKVLQALTEGNKMIPYRDSVLSSVLQDSLNSNSFLTLLACISPHREDLSETLSTLRFAQNAKKLKHTPKINNMILEVKKNRVRTPAKGNPLNSKNSSNTPIQKRNTPFKFGATVSTKKPTSSVHSNTFCTPGKVRKIEHMKFNQTDFGLTPREKMRLAASRKPVPKPPPFQFELPRYSDRKSPNETLDSRASLMSLNMSTSTTIDAPVTNSYSPVVRKCMAEFESTMESKLLKIVESLKVQDAVSDVEKTPFVSRPIPSTNLPWESIKLELRNLVREELLSLTEKKSPPAKSVIANKDDLDVSNVRCQLFAQDSPQFKVPEVPMSYLTRTESSMTADTNSSQEEGGFSQNSNQTVIESNRRRSRRISSMSETPMSVRRSLRLSVCVARQKELPVRSSIRRSSVAVVQIPEMPPIMKTIRRAAPLDNTIIAGYFKSTHNKNNKTPTKETTKNAKTKHKQAILKLLNSGTMKELQILPQVGLKTAYQLLTHRTLNGKFKTFDQVGKVPVWRGKSWDRFKKANNID